MAEGACCEKIQGLRIPFTEEMYAKDNLRTVLSEETMVVVGMILWDLLAEKSARLQDLGNREEEISSRALKK